MRLFNSFQITAAFVAWPFGIAWLSQQQFPGHTPAIIAACGLYVVAFGFMVAAVCQATEEWKL
jgi:hypothetical protein